MNIDICKHCGKKLSAFVNIKREELIELIIYSVYGWRADDYDCYNDYYVNPEYHRSETTRKRCQQQDEKDDE